jgi:hypothetical protein
VIRRLSGHPVHLAGAAAARVLVGAAAAHFYISNYAHRAFLFGPHSYAAHLPARGPTLYSIAHSGMAFELLYHAGIAAAVAFAIFGGRWLTLAHAVAFWSICARNPDVVDGGDIFGRIAAIFLIAAITNAYFAPGAERRRERSLGSVSTLAHNAAVVLLGFQIVVVYAATGLSKATGEPWRQGTALHQISQLQDYQFIHWTRFVANPVTAVLLTYAIITLEVGFPIAVWTSVRIPWIAALALMHTGIALTMGFVGFALNMWGGLAICLSDDDYRRIGRLIRAGIRPPSRARVRAWRHRPRNQAPATQEPLH